MKLLFTTIGSSEWTGGVTYILNLLNAVKSADKELKTYHFGPFNSDLYENELTPTTILYEKKFSKYSYSWLYHRLQTRWFSFLPGLPTIDIDTLNEIDIGFQILNRNVFTKLPVIAWIPDFQHVHLPQFFSHSECLDRDTLFLKIARDFPIVVLSSHSAKKDFDKCFPMFKHKSRVFHFVIHIKRDLFFRESAYVRAKFNLHGDYFYCPNQFWKHKNHLTLLRALRILKSKGTKVCTLFTGLMKDYRDPKHVENIQSEIADLEIGSMIKILGMVAYSDLISLIRESKAVINPSFFEGWSTTVEESKALGKSLILSDIDVHREQDPPNSLFFIPDNPEDLASKMEEMLNRKETKIVLLDELYIQNISKQIAYGKTFLKYAIEAKELFNK